MTKKQKGIIIVAVSILSIMLIVTMFFLIQSLLERNMYQLKLDNQYQKNYMQLKENFDDIEVDLSKLIATTSYSSQQTILQNLYTNCVLACDNLSGVPLNSSSLSKVNEISNKLGGYVYSLLESGSELSGDQINQIVDMHKSVSIVKYDLNKGYVDYLQASDDLASTTFNDETGSSFTAGLVSEENSYSDVPSLIYDGPFSDSVLNKTPKVEEDYVSEEFARRQVEGLLDYWKDYEIAYQGQTLGKLQTYNYNLIKDDNVIFVQILCAGGKLLNIDSVGNSIGDLISKEDGVDVVKNIAYDFGFDNMYEVWSQRLGDVLYVNLAPIEDGVIYYSDLIKVKLDLRGGIVLGWEASNYIYNHYDRNVYSCGISIIEAENMLSDVLQVEERNYCVIPNKYVGESNAFEFVCTWNDYKYYVYLDSHTGEELNIMRVVHTNNGDLLM